MRFLRPCFPAEKLSIYSDTFISIFNKLKLRGNYLKKDNCLLLHTFKTFFFVILLFSHGKDVRTNSMEFYGAVGPHMTR